MFLTTGIFGNFGGWRVEILNFQNGNSWWPCFIQCSAVYSSAVLCFSRSAEIAALTDIDGLDNDRLDSDRQLLPTTT